MRITRTAALLSTAAVVLLIGAGTVAAQGSKEQAHPERAPAAQQNVPAEKMAPAMHSGRSSETPGHGATEAPNAIPNGASKSHSSMDKNGTTGATPKSDMDKSEMKNSEKNKSQMNKSDRSESNKSEMKKGGAETKGQAGMQSGTIGQGAAASAGKLSTQQRTKITTIIKEKKVQPTHLNISVRVGARVPTSVHFYPLPTEVVEVYPEWRGYDYILVGNEILVIDPDSHEIVAILSA